ncbi:GNAT family N-acetyltransferase [Undibacterium baiyunense]|uniref:GNAT family N-acetyltransferase n=1 Tax=Undibacterium baiyunense TaxID=2828731 RepID=A0A941I3D5_9BURK|nr:GNAT family N-acetyltransferase [Undibacterium baiyunense]MBR7745909.1 GNAT family N-acetyltransferase [Undibacterium baiyunense]
MTIQIIASDNKYEILERYDDVAPFLEQVVRAADAHRNALGFFAESVFHDFARKERLLIITERSPTGLRYIGHLLFRPQYPRAHVMQMLTLPEFKRRGLASRLLDHLRAQLTRNGFISIYARVAEDLVESNEFWHKQDFYVQRVERGGDTRKRQIHVRCHELASPQLFPASGIDAGNPLGLNTSAKDVVPLFLLDLNVLFDVAPRRPRHNEVASLFQAERSNFCRLAISTEIRDELQRTAHVGRTDPMAAFISLYPAFPIIEAKDSGKLLNELGALIFPDRFKNNLLTANDRSDLRHVATVIQHGLAGLITNDQAILSAAHAVQKRYSIEIVSPAAFRIEGDVPNASAEFDTQQDVTLSLQEALPADEAAVRALLSKLTLSGSSIASGWMPIDPQGRIAKCCAVWQDGVLVGYATWAAKSGVGTVTIRIAVDEASPQALNAARILLIYMLDSLTIKGSQSIRLELPPNQSHVRELAAGFGFHSTGDTACLTKLVLGNVLTETNWQEKQSELSAKCGLKLPVTAPKYRNADQPIQVLTPNGNQTHVSLDLLETLLSPALLCLPGRPAVLTPIQNMFADGLLGSSPQASLLPRATASLFQDRHYLSDPRTLRHFKRGTIILFYESTRGNGRAAVVAIGRVREAYLRPADMFDSDGLEHSVLTTHTLDRIGKSKMKTVTVFDNIFTLPRSVPLTTLRRIGCGNSNHLITTRPLTDVQFQEILTEAFSRG